MALVLLFFKSISYPRFGLYRVLIVKKLSSALGFALSLGLFSVAVPSVYAAEMFNSQSMDAGRLER